MWTSSFVPNSEREFRPDHFCILLPTTSRVHYVHLTLNHHSSIDDVILENNDSIFLDHTSTPSSIVSIVCDRPASRSLKKLSVHLPTTSQIDFVDLTLSKNSSIDDDKNDSIPPNQSPTASDISSFLDSTALSSPVPSSPDVVAACHDVSSCPFDSNSKSSLLSSSVHPVAPGGQNLQGSTFMDIEKLINLLTTPIDMPLPTIPEGRKENKFFLINNERNIIRRGSDLGCTFSDDCGAWKYSPSAVSRMMKKQGKWKSVILKKGIYGTEKRMSGGKVFVSLEQQPTKDEVLKVHRIYNILKADASYKRRVSWLEPSPIPLACVEYLGMFQGAQIHGNSKNKKDPYIRTNPKVFDDIRENCCATKPREVYEKLKKVPNERERPVDLRQVQNISYNFHRKKRFEEGTLGCGKNLADNMQHIHNVIHSHPFVQAIFHIKNHVPSIVLYTKYQIEDIRRFSCSGPIGISTVLGVDKTFNLGQLHVTATVFKHLGVVRPSTCMNPIFLGPILIHGNSDIKTFSTFFHFLSLELQNTSSSPVIGSDDEKAIRNAACFVFKNSKLISCERHLKNNVISYLRDKIGTSNAIRTRIVNSIFGPAGITSSPSLAIFTERIIQTNTVINKQAASFENYFSSRLLPILRQNLNTILSRPEVNHGWTNNNSESMNHILKMKTDWKPQAIPHLIESIHEIVRGHYIDIERAFIERGEYRLAEGF